MRKQLIIVCLFIGLAIDTWAQKQIGQYEYWFDNNVTVNTVNINSVSYCQLNTTITTTGLPVGLHTFQIRFKETTGVWSSPTSQFFIKQPLVKNRKSNIVEYESWFDNNYNNKTRQSTSSQNDLSLATNISSSNLPVGLHTFQIRFKQTSGLWSSTSTQFFIKQPASINQDNRIANYEYWFDNDFSSKVSQAVSSQNDLSLATNISLSNLPAGLHTFQVRFKSVSGKWSSTSTQFFVKQPASINQDNRIANYEYWFDNNFSSKVSQAVSSQNDLSLATNISSNNLPAGLHTFQVRFKSVSGKWSSTSIQFFIKPAVTGTEENKIIAYEYWFNGFNNKRTSVNVNPINPLELKNVMLPVNVHSNLTKQNAKLIKDENGAYKFAVIDTLYIRYKDLRGLWSAPADTTFASILNEDNIDLTGFITNPDANSGKTCWTTSGTIASFIQNTSHWSGTTSPYFSLGNSSRTGWMAQMKQAITGLPTGNYVLEATGRSATDTKMTMSIAGNSIDFPSLGASGGEVWENAAEGSAEKNSNSGKGYGWSTRSIAFSNNGDTVTIQIDGITSKSGQWCDIDHFTLRMDNSATLNIAFPDSITALKYKGCKLQLINLTDSTKLSLTTSGKQTNTFSGLSSTATYKAILLTSKGAVVSSLDNVNLVRGNNSVRFTTLKDIVPVIIQVLSPNKTDITKDVSIKWSNYEKQFISQGDTLTDMTEGTLVYYSVQLNSESGMKYKQLNMQSYSVTANVNKIICRLSTIDSTTISGTLKDENKWAIQNGSVTVTQFLNGKYTKSSTALTDKNGKFSLSALNDSTVVTLAYPGYISQIKKFSNFKDTSDIGTTVLQPITGFTVVTDLTYTASAATGKTTTTNNYYSDYQNIEYQVYNQTQGKVAKNIYVQYPELIVQDSTTVNDKLQITATSKNNDFSPMTSAAIVNSTNKDTITINLVELGAVKATYSNSGNSSNVGLLYDAKGQLIKKGSFTNNELSLTKLPDGNYSFVSMGGSDYFSSMLNLSDFMNSGLAINVDYVLNAVQIKAGVISEISINTIPDLDESKFYYTGTNTSFSVNKTSVVAGNYVTLKGKVDFKDTYTKKVSNVNLIVAIPDSCSFVKNSVMVSSSVAPYVQDGNRITIPLGNNYSDQIKFCITPNIGGTYAPTAYVQFDYNNQTTTQPIGSASFTVEDMSIIVPSQTAKKTIPVTGTAPAYSTVTIYDGTTVIGQTPASATGIWQTNCELYEAYNLTTHSISAQIQTPAGNTIFTETKKVEFNVSLVEVKTVTMINTAHGPESLALKEYNTVFDFQNPSTTMQPYWYWPSYPDFTFKIDFTNNDTTYVSNVTLYVKTSSNDIVSIPASYDKTKDIWVATKKFYSSSLPVNLSVDYRAESKPLIDNNLIKNVYAWINSFSDNSISIKEDTTTIDKKLLNHFRLMSENEFIEYLSNTKDTLANINPDLYYGKIDFNNCNFIYKDGTIRSIIKDTCNQISEAKLFKDGFEKYELTNNSYVYYKIIDEELNYVDLQNNTFIQVVDSSKVTTKSNLKSIDVSDPLYVKYLTIVNLCTEIDKVTESIQNKIWDALNKLNNRFNVILSDFERTSAEINQIHYLMEEGVRPSSMEILKVKEYSKLAYRNWLVDQLSVYKLKIRNVMSVLNNTGSFLSFCSDAKSAIESIEEWFSIIDMLESSSCPGMKDLAVQARSRTSVVEYNYSCALLADFVGLCAVDTKKGALLSLACFDISVLANDLNEWKDETWKQEIRSQITTTNCDDLDKLKRKIKDKKKNGNGGGTSGDSGSGDAPHQMDPSGYVYEAVSKNRLEGVTATIYYKTNEEDMYGDIHEVITKWDATPYLQKNPLTTDENGIYAWDVPDGLWQVKYEKAGYETTYSDWLPVPPPQLDINVGMKHVDPSSVNKIRGYEEGINICFDKYMRPSTMITNNISVVYNGTDVSGTIRFLNEEEGYASDTAKYVSKLRFVPNQPFKVGDSVTVNIKSTVESYAGLKMNSDLKKNVIIEKEVKSISVDSLVEMKIHGKRNITVSALPITAAQGKIVTAKAISSSIISLENTQAVLDANGKASFSVNGDLPGGTSVQFVINDVDDLSAEAGVNVSLETQVSAPIPSISSGETVPKDTTITLSSATSGATIYYTTDGTSPNVAGGTRILYSTPVRIPQSMTLKTIATKTGFDDSPVMTYVYKVDTVAHVEASIISGSVVAKDTTVSLSCSTPNAIIYYTTDGTSPLNVNGTRQTYKNPITIGKDMKILAVAAKENMFTSKVSEFDYTIRYDLTVNIYQKWNDVLVCDNSESLFVNYQWYKNDEALSGETKQYYQEQGGLNGSYYVTVASADGSKGKSNIITTSSTSRTISISPNPVSQNQNFQITINASKSDLDGAQLSIYSLSGQALLKTQIETSNIYIKGLLKGSYLVSLKYKGGSSDSKKLIVY